MYLVRPENAQPDTKGEVLSSPVRVVVSKAVNLARAAWANEQSGRKAEAVELYQQAMQTLEPVIPPSHCEVSIPVLNNMAVLLRSLGHYDDAEAAYLRAVHLLEQEQQPKLRATLCSVLKNLAHLHYQRGNQLMAYQFLQRAKQQTIA
jgi:tetratricopeptide (TPR) repeat protein